MMTATLLTAYEKFGTVSMNEFIEMYIDEELEVTEDMIGDYNEYLAENGDETFFSSDEFDDVLDGYTPTEIARMTFYGYFRYADDYFRFNGYANLDSFQGYEIVEEMSENKDFLVWYIEKYQLIDNEMAEKIINECNALIAKGY